MRVDGCDVVGVKLDGTNVGSADGTVVIGGGVDKVGVLVGNALNIKSAGTGADEGYAELSQVTLTELISTSPFTPFTPQYRYEPGMVTLAIHPEVKVLFALENTIFPINPNVLEQYISKSSP